MVLKRISNHFLIPVAALFLFAAISINQDLKKPVVVVSKQDTAINLNTNFLRFMSFGNKRLISNVLWIQTLMESDHEKYFKKDYGNWMYLRFLTIAAIDPRFYQNYLYGGMYLSVIKDDLLGAADIFERGLQVYPNDYDLNYYAGFNYFFELGDFEKGYAVLKRIENHPKSNQLLKFIINKLRFETSGNYEVALAFLQDTYQKMTDSTLKAKIEGNIHSLRSEMDLVCLNSGKKGCSTRDIYGEPYVKDPSGKWVTKRPLKPYRIFRSQEALKRQPEAITP